jgi:hypothetical protein
MALVPVHMSSEDTGLLVNVWTCFSPCLFGDPCHSKLDTIHARISSYGVCFTCVQQPQMNNKGLTLF